MISLSLAISSHHLEYGIRRFVGIGQSLDYDAIRHRLVVSGVVEGPKGSTPRHSVISIDLNTSLAIGESVGLHAIRLVVLMTLNSQHSMQHLPGYKTYPRHHLSDSAFISGLELHART